MLRFGVIGLMEWVELSLMSGLVYVIANVESGHVLFLEV